MPRRRTAPTHRAVASRVGRPTTSIGTVAAVAMLSSIVLIVAANLAGIQGTEGAGPWARALFIAIVVGLFCSWAVGVAAVLRHRERSLVVLVPTLLLTFVVVNELVQVVVRLLGLD